MGADNPLFATELLDRISTGVVASDSARRISFANRTAVDVLMRAPEQLLGRDLAEVFGRELGSVLDQLSAGEERRVEALTLDRGDQDPLALGMTVLRLAPAGSALTYVLLFRDLADRRRLEAELRRVESLSALGSMVAGLAHGIRNPIAGMYGLAESLLDEMAEDDSRREYVVRILAQLLRLDALVRLSIRIGESKPGRRGPQDPRAIVASALEYLQPRLGRETPLLDVDADAPAVAVDPDQIAECLAMLLHNALDAVTDPRRVCLRLSVVPGQGEGRRLVCLEVADDGPGIPAALRSRVFEPFFTTKPKGTGLGLPLAEALVRENGGRVVYRPNASGGAVFSIELPEVAG
jgi:signal transduction histidine kinase